MKWIVYKLENGIEKEMSYSEVHLEIAKKEALNGDFIIKDDGEPDEVEPISQLDIIEAQVTYTAMMTDTLLGV